MNAPSDLPKLSLAERQAQARDEAFSMPLDQIDPAQGRYFVTDTVGHYFARLRRDAPVHRSVSPIFGPYWSVTRYADIMYVDTHHNEFSSDWSKGGITLTDPPPEEQLPMFIAMDPPRHDDQRKAVSPIVAPGNLAQMEHLIRQRTCKVLDELPRNETFNWVDKVSIELTTLMLATLFDFPLEDRRKLTRWSDVTTTPTTRIHPDGMDPAARWAELQEMLAYFTRLWNERVNAAPGNDLISMLAHNPATRNMGPMEYMGNLVLLIVGGNDTTRNSMTGGILSMMRRHPDQWAKLKANPGMLDNAVSEIIRWQTPLAHMRRTAMVDVEVGGQRIKAGEKVAMWYLSGNRDEAMYDDADALNIERPRPRQHLSFGFGIHRCVGNRLAEMQLKILWQEIMKRFDHIEVIDEPRRVLSSFVRGYTELNVRIPG
ncbi:MAG: cytochrome P450 [Aquabacterium sp.]